MEQSQQRLPARLCEELNIFGELLWNFRIYTRCSTGPIPVSPLVSAIDLCADLCMRPYFVRLYQRDFTQISIKSDLKTIDGNMMAVKVTVSAVLNYSVIYYCSRKRADAYRTQPIVLYQRIPQEFRKTCRQL